MEKIIKDYAQKYKNTAFSQKELEEMLGDFVVAQQKDTLLYNLGVRDGFKEAMDKVQKVMKVS